MRHAFRQARIFSQIAERLFQKAGLSLAVIDGGNHSLETENPMRNLDILKEVMQETRHFIRRETVAL